MDLILPFVGAFGLAFVFNLGLTPAIISLANRFQLFDRINARKIHTGNISRLAGIGIFLSFCVGAMVFLIVFQPAGANCSRIVLPVLGGAMVFGIGLFDDFYELRARYKLAVQLLSSLLVVVGGFVFSGIEVPGVHVGLGLGLLGHVLTFCWVLGIINAVNLIDGMDGLAGGASFFAAFAYGVIFWVAGHVAQGVVALALAGALFGFLVFNRPKAKIFMGDGGAYFLGFLLALLPLLAGDSDTAGWGVLSGLPVGRIGLVHAITLMLIPIGDTFAAIIRRRRKGQKFSEPDRHHMHHKMLAMGLSTWQVLLVVSAIELVAAAATVFDVLAGTWWSAGCLAASWVLVIGFFVYLDRAQYRMKSA